ncbi:MAG: hypothetical protein AAFV95_27445 [Bacteroidota bacterium]
MSTLTKGEFNGFEKHLYTASELETKRQLRLWAFFREHHPHYAGEPSSVQKLSSIVFEKSSPKKRQLQRILQKMEKRLENFLIGKELENAPLLKEQLLAKAFKRKDLNQRFFEEVETLKYKAAYKKKELGTLFEPEFCSIMFSVCELEYMHLATNAFSVDNQLPAQIMEYLDQYYLINKLRYCCEMMSRSRILNEQHSIFLLTELRQSLKGHPKLHPLIALYARLLDLYEDQGNDALFDQIQGLFQFHLASFDPVDARRILQNLLNHCVVRINAGEMSFKKRQFSLYRLGIRAGCLFLQQEISVGAFINIVTVAVAVKKPTWASTFIEKFQDCLPPGQSGDALLLAKAIEAFGQGEFNQATDLLVQLQQDDTRFKLWYRSWWVRSEFEICLQTSSQSLHLESFLQQFLAFLENNKDLADHRKEAYKVYIACVRSLHNSLFAFAEEKMRKWRQNILKKPGVIARAWLLEKMDQMLSDHTQKRKRK